MPENRPKKKLNWHGGNDLLYTLGFEWNVSNVPFVSKMHLFDLYMHLKDGVVLVHVSKHDKYCIFKVITLVQ